MDDADILFRCAGWAGQGLFTARMVVQWLASERARRSVAPRLFWWLSVGGTVLTLAFALYLKDPVFALAPAANLFFYARNLVLTAEGNHAGLPARFLWPMGGLCAALLAATLWAQARADLGGVPIAWLAAGWLGTGCWAGRFLLQWWISERQGKSLLTAPFWLASLGGASLLLAYSIHRMEEIFIVGYAFPLPLILRNLALVRRTAGTARAAG